MATPDHCRAAGGHDAKPVARGGRGVERVWGLAFLLLSFCLTTFAQSPGERLSQMGHMSWRLQDGAFSGSVNTIAQTRDGYLWIGTNAGLLRFDGVRFLPFEKETSSVLSLLADSKGNLWIGTASGLDRLKEGEFHRYPGLASHVNAIRQAPDGRVWIVRSRVNADEQPVCEVGEGGVRCYGTNEGIPARQAVLLDITDQGDLLIGSGNAVFRWNHGLLGTYVPPAVKDQQSFNGLRAVLRQPDGSILLGMAVSGTGRGLQRFDGRSWHDSLTTPSVQGSSLKISTLFHDRDGALWIGTSDEGLLRVHGGSVERFRDADGLTGNAVTSIFEDDEGNVWVATTKGLDCFRHLVVKTYSMKEGLQQESVESVAVAKDGGVWIGNGGGLARLVAGKMTTIGAKEGFPGQRVTSVYEDREGDLWVGIDADLYLFRNGKFSRVRRENGSGVGVVTRITETEDHVMYVVTTGPPNHLSRFDQRSMLAEELWLGPAVNLMDIDAVPNQGLYLSTLSAGNPVLSLYQNGKLTSLVQSEKPVRATLTHSEDGSVWGTSQWNVFRWKDGRTNWLSEANGLPCSFFYSAIADRNGNLWLYTRCGLIEIKEPELSKWWADSNRKVSFKVFDALAGAQPALASFSPTAVQATDGSLYFANGNVLQTLDPKVKLPDTNPPPVHIEEVYVNRQALPVSQGMRVSPLPRDIEFVYTGLCLSVPQRVNFRYKLEGHDTTWQDAGTRRQAFYTDLEPGRYRFRVIAEGATGLWNEVGDTLDVVVPSAWYQTRMFVIGCVVLVLGMLIVAYRARIRQVQAATQLRYDERLAERTRIARDIHDTLLQTLQGSKMLADDALDRENDPPHLKRTMQSLSEFLGRAMNEGRAALKSLRESTRETSNLAEAFQEAVTECKLRENMNVVFSVEGEPRPMHPIARDEVYRIGYEAIKNACRHSEGSLLAVTLTYGPNLILLVKDDGHGIDPRYLDVGLDGHFGLRGMRERAERINAQLQITSRPGAGTEVLLRVPESAIFDEEKTLWTRLVNRLSPDS
jgi:signal transduction histidine kinase/ligand-binding sensor domain-containing protein